MAGWMDRVYSELQTGPDAFLEICQALDGLEHDPNAQWQFDGMSGAFKFVDESPGALRDDDRLCFPCIDLLRCLWGYRLSSSGLRIGVNSSTSSERYGLKHRTGRASTRIDVPLRCFQLRTNASDAAPNCRKGSMNSTDASTNRCERSASSRAEVSSSRQSCKFAYNDGSRATRLCSDADRDITVMPLRDHFRPPVESRHSWDELHGGWPMMIVQQLYPQLPAGFVAVPSVHLGAAFEIDVSAYERDEVPPTTPIASRGGSAAVVEPPRPTLTVETELPDPDEYAVQIYDERHGRRLVAAIELISPANKDRPESRRSFMAKAVTLLQRGVCVSLVDVVSIRQFNLYADIIDFAGGHDPAVEQGASCLYAATIRGRKQPNQRSVLESWYYPMQIGHPLPTLPLWLEVDLSVPLELEASYEETCRYLHID